MRETLFDFASNELYKHVSRLGDRLNHIRDIHWSSVKPSIHPLNDVYSRVDQVPDYYTPL
jgi:hypothetical protein